MRPCVSGPSTQLRTILLNSDFRLIHKCTTRCDRTGMVRRRRWGHAVPRVLRDGADAVVADVRDQQLARVGAAEDVPDLLREARRRGRPVREPGHPALPRQRVHEAWGGKLPIIAGVTGSQSDRSVLRTGVLACLICCMGDSKIRCLLVFRAAIG